MGHAKDQERLSQELCTFQPRVLSTTLPSDQEQRLRDQLAS